MVPGHWTHSLRTLRREPRFTLFAALTLALGIGAGTAVFSVVQGVLLNPLPFADPRTVVALNTRFTDTGWQIPRLSGPDWADVAKTEDMFDAIAWYHGGEVGVQLRDRAEFAGTFFVTPGFFSVFGARPVRGRLPVESDGFRSALVSSGFAERAFGPDHAPGQTLRVDTQAFAVIGVMPREFRFPATADLWIVYDSQPGNHSRSAYNYRAVARLKPRVTAQQADARLDALAAQLTAAEPGTNKAKSFTAVPLREQLVGNARATIFMLLGAVGLLLLISCANVANLLLARGVARAREYAVRAAVGASRRRLFLESLFESAALGLLGGAFGILLSYAGVELLVRAAPPNLPRLDEVRVDDTVMAFGIAVSLLSAVLFGLAPAWQATRADLQQVLRQTGRGPAGARGNLLRSGLVAAEVALSFALVIGAGLLFRSFVALNQAELGFRTQGILVAYAHAPANTMKKLLATTQFFESLVGELRRLPGVVAAAAVMGLPAGQYSSNGLYFVEGRDSSPQNAPNAGLRLAGAGYFAAMGIPLLRGRDFDPRDRYEAPFVAIVSESLAKRSFPGEDPIGRRIRCGLDSPEWMTIVGVVGDVRSESPASAPGPELYMPFQQHPVFANELQLVVRTEGPPGNVRRAVESAIRQRNALVATKFTTMDAILAGSVSTPRFRAFLVGLFAAVAMTLALAGIYGLISYVVAQRTSEWGVRLALGATSSSVVGLILRRAAVLAGLGLAGGLAVAGAASRLLESMLFGLRLADPLTYLVASAGFALMAMIAAGIPALRAAAVEPAVALRE